MCFNKVVILLVQFLNLGCGHNHLKLGFISNGPDLVEEEKLTRNDNTFLLSKHYVDTSHAIDILRAVQILDQDSTVDVILLADYDSSILKMQHLFMPQNKSLIPLGATSKYSEKNIKAADNDDHSCEGSHTVTDKSSNGNSYCFTNLNTTCSGRDEQTIKMPGPATVSSIVNYLRWTHVIIFYERETEMEIAALVDKLSIDNVMFMMFDIEEVNNLHQLLHRIYKSKTDENMQTNVVIACTFHNTMRILRAANKFDSFQNQKTLLKKFSRWLVVMYGYRNGESKTIQECVNELDNVVTIALPELKYVGLRALYKGVGTISIKILGKEATDKLPVDFKKSFIDELHDVESWSQSLMCRAFHIDTLLWTNKGREFSSVGYADIDGKIVLESDVFPNEKYGYNKRRFLVSTLAYSPFVIKKEENNSYIYEGFCMDLLNELAYRLNFTYDLTEPKDGKWGSTINSVNLSFNGLIGQLQREEVDIVAAPISVQAERNLVMDASYPYFYEYTTVLVKKPDPQATKWRTLIDPFKWEVLIFIGVSLVSVTVLAFLVERYNPFYDVPENRQNRLVNGGLHTWHSSFWYVFGALLCQGGVHLPESTAGRTLISCWWLTCIIIVGTYCGNLIAFLTVTKERPPFDSLQEMIKLKDTYKWGTLGGTAWEMTFPTSSNPTFREMGAAFLEFNKTDPTILHQDPQYHVDRVKRGKYAWIGDKTFTEIAMAKECSLMTIKEEFMPLIYVFGFTNSSPHAALFSAQMIKINEGGLFQIWKRKWWPKSNFCAGSSIPEAKPISFMDVQSAFYVCFIGVFIGALVFLVEICVHKYQTNHWINGKGSSSMTTNIQEDKSQTHSQTYL